ncbi:MAG: hypothetical protein MRERC_11c042 [Mycoplasmataceae bacterium RC_NB112A]|nr:MAG: hypothetical protein MRERC_11c042 [Mycoplasmataceae bacterium RC_NB112A]
MVNAQEWLDKEYPNKKEREDVKKLDIGLNNLEGKLNLSGFSSLEQLDCSNNNLTVLILDKASQKSLCHLDCSGNSSLKKITPFPNNLISFNPPKGFIKNLIEEAEEVKNFRKRVEELEKALGDFKDSQKRVEELEKALGDFISGQGEYFSMPWNEEEIEEEDDMVEKRIRKMTKKEIIDTYLTPLQEKIVGMTVFLTNKLRDAENLREKSSKANEELRTEIKKKNILLEKSLKLAGIDDLGVFEMFSNESEREGIIEREVKREVEEKQELKEENEMLKKQVEELKRKLEELQKQQLESKIEILPKK